MTRDAGLEVGVFYRPEDYVGVWRRLMIDAVDTFVVTVASLLLSVSLLIVWPDEPSTRFILAVGWALVWFGYFVLLKRSRFRTLGYIFAGARIVNLKGGTPSVWSLLGRLLFVGGGPANFLIDILWIPSDPSRQAIRDKFAHTYVIRRDATPIGSGRIVYRTYAMLGTTFLFQEVRGAGALSGSSTDASSRQELQGNPAVPLC